MESLLILYGSQTGNAEEISKTIFTKAQAKYASCQLMCMKDFIKKDSKYNGFIENFKKINIVIFIASTTGKGDPPDNARKFIRFLRKSIKKDKNWLRNCRSTPIQYTVLGLGDTNYDDFCNTGKNLNKLMIAAGCELFYPIGLADDGTGLDIVVEPWIQGLFPQLDELFNPLVSLNDTRINKETELNSIESKEPTDLKRSCQELNSLERREIKKPKINHNTNELSSIHAEKKNQHPVEKRSTNGIMHSRKLPRYRKSQLRLTYALKDTPPNEKTSYFVQRWTDLETERELKGYTPEAPFMATVVGARFLTHPKSLDRRVIHMDIALPEDAKESVMYVPGDAIGIYCPNNADIVRRLLKRLDLCEDTQIVNITNDDQTGSVPTHINISNGSVPTIADIFYYCLDIHSCPRKSFLRMLAEWCNDINDQQKLYKLCSLSSVQIAKMQPSLLELLEQFPSCFPDLSDLIAHLPALKPRYYSIACCQNTNPTKVQIAFTLVNYKTPKPYCQPRKGLCTHWLYKICQEAGFLKRDTIQNPDSLSFLPSYPLKSDSFITMPPCLGAWKSDGKISIPIFLRRSNDFCPPIDISKPVIMVGPGTGIAPFRGFLQQRQSEKENIESGGTGMGSWRGLEVSLKDEEKEINPRMGEIAEEEDKVGEMILFHGCRHPDVDFLYKDEIENFVDLDVTSVYTAFSRLHNHKEYVQHKMSQHGPRLVNLILNENALVFVCGDGTKMGRDVMQRVEDLLHQYGDLSLTDAKQYVIDMIKNKRYIADLWS